MIETSKNSNLFVVCCLLFINKIMKMKILINSVGGEVIFLPFQQEFLIVVDEKI
jgi:hypothetical protein